MQHQRLVEATTRSNCMYPLQFLLPHNSINWVNHSIQFDFFKIQRINIPSSYKSLISPFPQASNIPNWIPAYTFYGNPIVPIILQIYKTHLKTPLPPFFSFLTHYNLCCEMISKYLSSCSHLSFNSNFSIIFFRYPTWY